MIRRRKLSYKIEKIQRDDLKLNIFIKGKFIFSSEMILLTGILKNYPREGIHCYNHNNEIRYGNLLDICTEEINIVNKIEDCDIIVLPYKFRGDKDNNFKNLEELALKNNKKLLCFFNDDDDKNYILKKNTILYRTSFYKSKKSDQEKAMIAFSADRFNNNYKLPELNIGYCGHTERGRMKYLDILQKSEINTNFIFRNGFWAPGIDKLTAIKEYYKNIEDNLFIFCYRGGGNFSYRFYETLMMGRIPILINTDCVFPFEDKVDINKISLVIDEKDIINENYLIDRIKDFYQNNDLVSFQRNNRNVWLKYFSPEGFVKNLIGEYKK